MRAKIIALLCCLLFTLPALAETRGVDSSHEQRYYGRENALAVAGRRVWSATLASNYTNSTTTGTEVMSITSVPDGIYKLEAFMNVQTAATTTGAAFGINVTGANSAVRCVRRELGTGTTAVSGVSDSIAASPQIIEGYASASLTTTSPNMGPSNGVSASSHNHLVIIECLVTVGTTGDVELWAASEVAASALTIGASRAFLMLTKMD